MGAGSDDLPFCLRSCRLLTTRSPGAALETGLTARVRSDQPVRLPRWVILYVVGMLAVAAVAGSVAWRFLHVDDAPPMPESPAPAATVDPALPSSAAQTPVIPVATTLVQAVAYGPVTFNPLFAADPAAEAVIDLIYPRLMTQDPFTGASVPSALVAAWEISPDGLVYTFRLRPDVRWSDGEPVSSADFVFTYAALADPAVGSPYRDRTIGIAAIAAPDPTTVVVTLAAPNCALPATLRHPLLPSRYFAADRSDLADHPFNRAPGVSAGPYRFIAHEGDRVVLRANPDYHAGAPQIAEWVVQTLPDPAARRAALVAGTVHLAYFAPDEVQTAPEAGTGVLRHAVPTDGYLLLALNLADPVQPLPGLAEDGTRIPQPPHPILGDPAVRQALAAALDGDALLREHFAGLASRNGSYVPPMLAWAAAPIPPPVHDPARAAQLLDAAGWQLAPGETVRRRAETPLSLRLSTNADNPLRVALAQQIAAQLAQAGFAVELRAVAFDELAAELLGQRFDLALFGWEGLGGDPGTSPFWHSRDDLPGAGFNVSSVQDAEIDAWLDAAITLPGCDPAARADLYRQVQQRVALLRPSIILAQPWAVWAVSSRLQGLAPAPWRFTHNVTGWWIQE